MEAYLVVPARQLKPWRVLLDRDDNVLDGARFLYLRDAVGARLLSDDVRAAALALGLPFPATGIVSQICHDSKHDRFLIRVVWIGPQSLIRIAPANQVSRAELHRIPTPEPTATWHPIAHHLLLSHVRAALSARDIGVISEEHGLQSSGDNYFGGHELAADHCTGGREQAEAIHEKMCERFGVPP